MNTEQERAAFEAWHKQEMWDGGYESGHDEFYPDAYRINERRVYEDIHTQIAWRGYQAGRAALQSQPMPPEISRDLLGKIVDEVFDGAIEDASVIEDIYRVVARECALQSQDSEEVMEMALCESRRLVLRIGQAYRFVPMEGCKTCEELKAEHDQAYAIDHARRGEGEGE